MLPPIKSLSPVLQVSWGTVHLADRLNQLISMDDLKRLRIAVSYVRWSGLGILALQLESFLERGGELQTIYGIGNGVTTPDSLLCSLYLRKIYSTHTYAGVIYDQYQNATFHPKFFEFKFARRNEFRARRRRGARRRLRKGGRACCMERHIALDLLHELMNVAI
jgi:hypothetical protein